MRAPARIVSLSTLGCFHGIAQHRSTLLVARKYFSVYADMSQEECPHCICGDDNGWTRRAVNHGN